MMEKYKISDNNNLESVNLNGEYFNRIRKKHIDTYGEYGSKRILDNVINMFEKSQKIMSNPNNDNHNLLVVGKVQSGKTSNLELFTSLAFDNGYNLIIIYGGYDNSLLNQTITRFKQTFDTENASSDKHPKIYDTSGRDIDGMDDDLIEEIIFEDGHPIILVSMNRPSALNKINEMLKRIDVNKIKVLIIDDEGDQASLNTKFRKKEKSSTYETICKMKKLLNNPLYLSVTATPQANIFQPDRSELVPSDISLIHPSNGYTGAEQFHLIEDHIVIVDDYEEDEKQSYCDNVSLQNAVKHYIISSAIMRKRGIKRSDMIIHTDRRVDVHSELYKELKSVIDNMKDVVKNNQDDIKLYLNEFKKVYNANFFSKEIFETYPFETLVDDIKTVMKKIFLILQNSDGKDTMAMQDSKKYRIYIGGDLLQRGVTFQLVTTYFTRWTKKGNMDTVLQRCRWFGYREKFIDLCRIFTTEKIMMELASLAEIENDLWSQFADVELQNIKLPDIIVDSTNSTLNPTRKNVAEYIKIQFKKKWHNQRSGVFDVIKINNNNALFDTLLTNPKYIWKHTSKGRTDGVEWARYCYIDKHALYTLIENIEEIFDKHPFDKKVIFKNIEDKKIVLIDMNTNKLRYRTFSDGKISAIQQGSDKVNEDERKYLGDASVLIDPESINIQIFKVQPKGFLNEYTQYMISIHFPEERKGFVKGK